MGKFTHYLLTRFNVMAEGLGPEFIAATARAANWEEERLTLFQQYCAPTVNSQSSIYFTWLLPILPEHIRQSIDCTVTCQVIPVSHYSEMMQRLRDNRSRWQPLRYNKEEIINQTAR